MESAPDLLPWVDIENIQRFPDIFAPGEDVVLTEKLHGSACLLTYLVDEDRVHVSSKGFGAKSLALKEDPRNLYWRAVHGHGRLRRVFRFRNGPAVEIDASALGRVRLRRVG